MDEVFGRHRPEMAIGRPINWAATVRRATSYSKAATEPRPRTWPEAPGERPAAWSPPPELTGTFLHHAPSARSLNPRHAASALSAAYASALDELVGRSGAACWVHGHTHTYVDYVLGATRVLSNQRGYPDEPAEGFDPGLVVTVDEDGHATVSPAS